VPDPRPKATRACRRGRLAGRRRHRPRSHRRRGRRRISRLPVPQCALHPSGPKLFPTLQQNLPREAEHGGLPGLVNDLPLEVAEGSMILVDAGFGCPPARSRHAQLDRAMNRAGASDLKGVRSLAARLAPRRAEPAERWLGAVLQTPVTRAFRPEVGDRHGCQRLLVLHRP
jgi:hypothetical protein